MRWSDVPLRPTYRMLRQFAAAWLVFFLAIAAYQHFAQGHSRAGLILAGVALLGGLPGLLKPSSIRWLYIAATLLAFPIGWAVSQLVLAVMFYCVLTPIALVFKWRRRDALSRQPESRAPTYWQPKQPELNSRRYLRQY